jgi:hypothetical protein
VERNRIVAATYGNDPGRNFVGGPGGALTNFGLIVPSLPTTSQNNRYTGRLAAFAVGPRQRAIITNIRQLLTIAAPVQGVSLAPRPPSVRREAKPIKDSENGSTLCVVSPPWVNLEREVRTPFWSFPDGNVLWFLRAIDAFRNVDTLPTGARPGWTNNPAGTDSAWMFVGTPPPTAPYTAPGNGLPTGRPLGQFGTMNSIEFPYRSGASREEDMCIEVEGPCIVSMSASVWQPDPSTRVVPSLGVMTTTESGLEDEDLFWINFPCAQYYRIGAEITARFEDIPRSRERHPACPADPGASCPQSNPDPSNPAAQASCMEEDEL